MKKAKAKVIHTTGQVTREKGVETKKKRKLTLQRKEQNMRQLYKRGKWVCGECYISFLLTNRSFGFLKIEGCEDNSAFVLFPRSIM